MFNHLKNVNGNQDFFYMAVNLSLIATSSPFLDGRDPEFKSAPGTPRTARGRGGECVLKFFSGFM